MNLLTIKIHEGENCIGESYSIKTQYFVELAYARRGFGLFQDDFVIETHSDDNPLKAISLYSKLLDSHESLAFRVVSMTSKKAVIELEEFFSIEEIKCILTETAMK